MSAYQCACKAALCVALVYASSWAQAVVPSASARSGPPLCADFLAKLGQKPKNLEFMGCKPVRLFGVAALHRVDYFAVTVLLYLDPL